MTALWLFVEITGGTLSAVRAFIMVTLLQASFVLRAPANPVSALAVSALVVLLVHPMQLFSASFQLSYGIVTALLLLGLPLYDAWQARWALFRDLPKPAWRWYHDLAYALQSRLFAGVAIGLAATLVSTLGTVLFFKLFTPAALLANLVLIPAALLVILAGFGSLLCGLAGATALSGLFNHAAALVLAAIQTGIRAVVAVPGTWRPAEFLAGWIGPAAFVLLMAALVFGYASNWQRDRGGWWPPFAVVAVTLALGVRFG
jgi:competence protein ComEC